MRSAARSLLLLPVSEENPSPTSLLSPKGGLHCSRDCPCSASLCFLTWSDTFAASQMPEPSYVLWPLPPSRTLISACLRGSSSSFWNISPCACMTPLPFSRTFLHMPTWLFFLFAEYFSQSPPGYLFHSFKSSPQYHISSLGGRGTSYLPLFSFSLSPFCPQYYPLMCYLPLEDRRGGALSPSLSIPSASRCPRSCPEHGGC